MRVLIALCDVLPATAGGPVTPDSLRMDRQGNVLAARYNGGGVAIVSPAGKLLRLLDVPAAHHTNLAMSPDGASLFVTAVDDDPQSTYRGQIVWIATQSSTDVADHARRARRSRGHVFGRVPRRCIAA